ncbi:F18 fimbrial protein FedE [Plesiomonas shigelloides]|uniref:type 1 fimbrial protein n=1 Tax=Plesiomonas shigelloides TaxID=703 RepID=UPI0012623A73|nr:type 1 fimbrial protein [Plesiomonas shigelloides]KAB7714799.1 F18 fimbrial protein FedE [Plesiomonas shigelloides]
MKFTKIRKLCSILFAACSFVGVAHAATESSATLTINVTFVAPTCTIDVPSTYNLGGLQLNQTKEHAPLMVKWSCEGADPVKTALTASVVTGTLDSTQDKVKMLGEDGRENGTTLSLKEKSSGQKIKLTGSDTDVFCSGNAVGDRSCELIPITETHIGDAPGQINSTLRFAVVYQ